ncbi:MAG: hypothetical protein PHC62_09370 [Candidatus Izemoplasmatales bacterium]|jgi:hypothetical protein|nr:hypothetical protein [Candidatus Izemoplasmatales bacterium]
MKKNIDNFFPFIIMIIGIIVTAMLFLPALSFPDSDSSFLGYEVVFGTEFVNLGSFASGEIVWSILGVIAYISPLIGGLLVLYFRKSTFTSMALFTVGAVLLFTLPSYTKTTVTLLGTVTEINIDWVVSYGLIIAGVLSAVGAFLCLFKFIYKK